MLRLRQGLSCVHNSSSHIACHSLVGKLPISRKRLVHVANTVEAFTHPRNSHVSDYVDVLATKGNGLPQHHDAQTLHVPGKSVEKVWVRFSWPASFGGESISISGSFNNWTKPYKLQRFSKDGDSTIMLYLKPGAYEYKYIVDNVWQAATHEQSVANQQGTLNNYCVASPTAQFHLHAPDAETAFVVGEWDNWQISLKMDRSANGDFFTAALLQPGTYNFKFLIDGHPATSNFQETFPHPEHVVTHKVHVQAPHMFRVFYATGWDEATLMFRRLPKAHMGKPPHPWEKVELLHAPSRARGITGPGSWMFASILCENDNEHIEFWLQTTVDGEVKEDRAPGGHYYVLHTPGSYKLAHGSLKPFPRGQRPRFMLVSDIDGTMIAETDSSDPFASSERFQHYWEHSAALSGCVLVYNTGRSLGQFVQLLKECKGRLAVPDVLITAVGTKVWALDETCGRCGPNSGSKWVEDKRWTSQLDEGWRLSTVQSVVGAFINSVDNPEQVHWLDRGTEHPHRVALSVQTKLLEHTKTTLAKRFEQEGLQVRMIVSGNGTYRYLDCVPIHGGKEKALQYVRQMYGIPDHLCVAAGDSGNDVLMLDGAHPAVVVGNSQHELVSWLMRQPQDGKIVYSDAWYADGILEGLCRHGLY